MSQVPAASFIEAAADDLAGFNPGIRAGQQSELSAFGAAGAQAIGASGLTNDFRKGYELGLQTARETIAGSAVVQQFNIDPGQIL